MTADEIISRLDGVKGGPVQFTAKCPGHDDKHASLSITRSDDGTIALHCHAGCKPDDVCKALGITMKDLFPNKVESTQRRIVQVSDYTDETGKLLFQTLRYEPKDFRQRRPDGSDGWIYNLQDTRRVVYRLPELLQTDARETIFIPEGEKDCDRLYSMGLKATCNSMGAGKWRPEYNQWFTDRHIVVIVDNDEAGRNHAKDIYKNLKDIAAELRFVYLDDMLEHSDISDWFDAGGSKEKLLDLIESAPNKPFVQDNSLRAGLQYLKAEHIPKAKSGQIIRLPVPWQTLADAFGGGGIETGKIGLLVSLSGVGKTWAVYQWALHAADTQREREPVSVFIVNTEISKAQYMKRFIALLSQNPIAALPGHDRHIQELEKSIEQVEDILNTLPIEATDTGDYDVRSVEKMIQDKAHECKFIIVDHLGEIDTLGVKEYEAFPKFIKRLRDIARINNTIILLVSHLRKGPDGSYDLAYSKRMMTTFDFLFALKGFEPKDVEVISPCGTMIKEVNRSMYIQKMREGESDYEIAFNFSSDTLLMTDEGRIKRKVR